MLFGFPHNSFLEIESLDLLFEMIASPEAGCVCVCVFVLSLHLFLA